VLGFVPLWFRFCAIRWPPTLHMGEGALVLLAVRDHAGPVPERGFACAHDMTK